MTQKDLLIHHFKKQPSISNIEAQMMYKIRALPRRIKDLEECGMTFVRQRKIDATGQRYVRYVLAS